MKKDPRKEARYRLIMVVFCILFFGIATKCSSQVTVFRGNNTQNKYTVRYFPERPMKFNCGNNDTTTVSVLADSGQVYNVRLFAQFPSYNEANKYTIVIGFTDGSMQKFKPTYVSKVYNYCEYRVDDQSKLRTIKFDYLAFSKEGVEEACINIKTKSFFIDFFKALR